MKSEKPTAAALQAAASKLLPDLIAPCLKGLFCGINPSLYSAALGYHFARPGNRFWPALHAGGITEKQLKPHEQHLLLRHGWGITNVVERPTTAAADLSNGEILEGAEQLKEKVLFYKPAVLAFLGLTVYKSAFNLKEVTVGPQPLNVGNTRIWVLPNPSGLNAHYTPKKLAELFGALKKDVELYSSR